MRLRWATDIHLDFLPDREADAFCASLFAGLASGDQVVVTGDISNAGQLGGHLRMLRDHAQAARACVSFVLGNHDYYGSSVAGVRAMVRQACDGPVAWLGDEWQVLSPDRTALVGVDGWADARVGNPNTGVLMNDFRFINDLADRMPPRGVTEWRRGADRTAVHEELRRLADAEAASLRVKLAEVLEGPAAVQRVVVATHVPPWPGACWHEGAMSGPEWLPYFCCVATGQVLEEVAASRPDVRFAVLCGHTHGAGVFDPLPNLRCHTGGAEYRRPSACATFDLDAPDGGGLFR